MKRRPGELRYDFCARRIMEQEEVKAKLAGTLVHCSSALIPSTDEKYKDLPENERPLMKIAVQGTYRKPKKDDAPDKSKYFKFNATDPRAGGGK